MAYFWGVALGLAVGGFAALTGLDRGRSFWPTVLIVVASYYALYAVIGGGGGGGAALAPEIAGGLLFAAVAVAGLRWSLWIVAAGLLAHAAFDSVHHLLIVNPGMPAWWPAFCLSIDGTMALWMAARLWRGAGAGEGR